MDIRQALFLAFIIYIIAVVICSFKIVKRAKIINSFWDLLYDLIGVRKKLLDVKWDVSEFPTIDSNDLMLRFVVFSQKRKYYIFFTVFILMNIFS